MQLRSLLDKEYPQPRIWKHSGPDNQLEQVSYVGVNNDDLQTLRAGLIFFKVTIFHWKICMFYYSMSCGSNQRWNLVLDYINSIIA